MLCFCHCYHELIGTTLPLDTLPKPLVYIYSYINVCHGYTLGDIFLVCCYIVGEFLLFWYVVLKIWSVFVGLTWCYLHVNNVGNTKIMSRGKSYNPEVSYVVISDTVSKDMFCNKICDKLFLSCKLVTLCSLCDDNVPCNLSTRMLLLFYNLMSVHNV